MRIKLLISLLAASCACWAQQIAPGSRDGEVRALADGGFLAWDAGTDAWLEPEAFWSNFADRGRGKRWPDGDSYPPYSEVSEHDAFLVMTEQGPCLMYFFHTRWRRANDVWRWGPEFNRYGGCPHVFN